MSAYDHIGEAGYLVVNDYIYSPSRLYFIVLETNGQLNTYAGDSPDDPQKIQVGTSATTVPPGGQDLMLILRKGPFDQNIKNLQIFLVSQTDLLSNFGNARVPRTWPARWRLTWEMMEG